MPSRFRIHRLRTMLFRRFQWVVQSVSALLLGVRLIVTGAGLPRILIFFGLAPGDDLLCSTVLRELRERGKSDVLMISNHRELFLANHDVAYIWQAGNRNDASRVFRYRRFAQIWGSDFRTLVYPNGQKG